MRKQKEKCKRIISILLVAAMLMGSLSPYVYAADVTGHVTGAADVMLEGDAYVPSGVEEELSTVGAEDFDELDILDAADPLTDDVDTIMDNASIPYDVSSQDMIIENSETVNEDMNLDEFAPVAQPVYSEGCILIYSYQQLLLIGSEEPVHVGDIVSEDIGTGDEVTDEEGNRVYYAKDGTYSPACDIPLDSEDFWQIPEDFEGQIAPLSNAEDKPLYASETDTIYIYNIKQLASLTIEDTGLYPVMSGDADVATFGSGQLIYPDSEEDEKSFLTYSKEHTYVLSVAFTTDLPVMRNMLRGPLRAVDDPLGGRDFEGQVLKEINGITYILIGNKEQLQHIGTGDEVYTRVYQVIKRGSSIAIDKILYEGDADIPEPNNPNTHLFHYVKDRDTSITIDYEYAGVIQTGVEAGQLGQSYDTKDIGNNIVKRSWQTGRYYTTDENYIIFRDIDLNNETWNPLMFTGTMYGARSENPGTTGSLWSCFQAAGADGKPNELNVVGGVRPTISNINVVPVITKKSLTNETQVLDVDEQKGVGFFGTIAAEYSRSSIMSSTAIVKSIRLEGGSINNTMSEGGVRPTLTSIALKTLGDFLNPVVEALLKRVTGKDSVEIPGGLGDLLDTRKDIPSYLATGAFAGRIMGNAIVEDCEVSDITVTTVQTVHEQNTASGRKIVGKGGFVGYVEGETRYDAISNALATVTDSLERLLNLIPGLGLGDLVTLLLENVLPLENLIPTGYYTPIIDRCVVDNGHLSNEPGKYGVGGFAGSVSGVIIRKSNVKNSTMTVNADHFGGGFAGVARDAIINGTLSGLGIEVSSALHPQAELIKCSIEASTMTVVGGDYLGGFTGVLANSYAFNNTIDAVTVTTVTGTGNYVGGFTGSAELGTLLGLGGYLARDTGALGTLTGLVGGLLGDENSNDKALLDLGGVAPAAIMGCQIDGPLTVTSDGSYVGGIVGRGEGTYITCSSPANIRKLAPYARQRDGEYVKELPIQDNEKRANLVKQLVSVTARGDYAGGIAGYLTTASAGGVLGNTVGLADYIPFHLWLTTVKGADGGYTVNAVGNYAGGGIGWAVGGDIKDIKLIDLKSVEANNRAGGFVGATGPGDLVNGGGIDEDDENLVKNIVNVLGLDLDITAQVLNIVGSTVENCKAVGYDQGFITKTTSAQEPVTNVVNIADLIGSCSAGFTGFGDIAQIKNCHVSKYKYADGPQIAAGFIGRSSFAYLADLNAESPLVQLVMKILDVLVRALYLSNLEQVNLINAGGNLLGLKVLSDGDLLYVNLFGLKIGVALSKQDSEYEDNSDAVIITLGSSTIKLPCDETGINDTNDTPNIVLNLIQANRTSVKESSVTGIEWGYDIFAGGSDRDQAGTDPLGYAGGFVGYNDLGYFSDDRMWLCDEVCGTPGKVGPFTGQTKVDSTGSYTPEYLEGSDHNNFYSIYREKENSLTEVVTGTNSQVFGSAELDTSTGTPYNRYDVLHRDVIKTHTDLENAKETGTSERDLKAYVTAAKADLMLATPLTPNGESEAVEPDELKDPCSETVDIHIHKKWRDYGNLLSSRPDSIKVQVLAIDVGTKPRWQLIQSIFPESAWTIVNGILNVVNNEDNTVTIEGNIDEDGTIHWSYDVKDLPVAYDAIEMEENENGEKVPKVKKDGQGNPVYEVELDENGIPELDESGKPKLKQQTDDNGNLVFELLKDENGELILDENGKSQYKEDESGNKIPVYVPVYETEVHYIQYVITEMQVEGYKVPHYKILEDTASVIITNELDGIILPGTGAEGIYKLLMLGMAILTLGAFLFLKKYREMRNEAA